MFNFSILSKDKKSKARTGEFFTPHGKLETPELAFVATEGEIKAIPKEILPALPINLIIVNTFHLWVKKIIEKFSSFNFTHDKPISTIHHYANFPRPIASDSGGFQVFSLGFGKSHGVGKVASIFPDENHKSQITNDKSMTNIKSQNDKNNPLKITEEGVTFHFNEKMLTLTPELSIKLQQKIGADIIFAFDECTSPLNSYEYTKKAMERTHRWLLRCIRQYQISNIKYQKYNSKLKNKTGVEILGPRQRAEFFQPAADSSTGGKKIETCPVNQALFAIVQGGYFEDLRKKSAQFIGRQDVPGFGIGGSLGKTKQDMYKVLEWTIPYLPEEKPRHLLGIGQVRDIFEAVERGIDLFDCVIPTREARHRILYTKKGKINVRKYKTVNNVADKTCQCLMCKEKITLDKLYELYKLDKLKAFFYATIHNIQFFSDLMKEIRESIIKNKFSDLKNTYLQYY